MAQASVVMPYLDSVEVVWTNVTRVDGEIT